MRSVIGNLVLFQLGWLACVLGGAHGYPWLGAGAALAVVVWHVLRSPRQTPELQLICAAGIGGFAFDSLLVSLGYLNYASPVPFPGLAPVWIVALWLCFATTLNVGLRWLRGKTWLAVLLGAAGGPLAFIAGERLGGVELTTAGILSLAFGWAIITPLLLRLAERLDGWPEGPARVHAVAAG